MTHWYHLAKGPETMICPDCATEYEGQHALEQCIRALVEQQEELRDDRCRALKRADALTLDTQTCEEATTALVSMVHVSRADAERQRTRADAAEAKLAEAEREAATSQHVAEERRERAKAAEARATEAERRVRELIEVFGDDCANMPTCDDEIEPLPREDWCRRCDAVAKAKALDAAPAARGGEKP